MLEDQIDKRRRGVSAFEAITNCTEVYEDHADKLGKTASSLLDQEKQQAIIRAIIDNLYLLVIRHNPDLNIWVVDEDYRGHLENGHDSLFELHVAIIKPL